MPVITVTSYNYEEEIEKSDVPVLIDFWASWCGPCKMQSPIIDEVANETVGTAKVGKINVDEEPELAQKYNITSIPTLLVLKEGEVIKQAVGLRDKEEILEMLK